MLMPHESTVCHWIVWYRDNIICEVRVPLMEEIMVNVRIVLW